MGIYLEYKDMRNIKSLIYQRLVGDTLLADKVKGVYPNVAPKESGSPVIIYNHIVDERQVVVRNSLYQVSIRGGDLEELELLKERIVWLFSRYKADGVSRIVQSINESYDHETEEWGIHITMKCKLIDSGF